MGQWPPLRPPAMSRCVPACQRLRETVRIFSAAFRQTGRHLPWVLSAPNRIPARERRVSPRAQRHTGAAMRPPALAGGNQAEVVAFLSDPASYPVWPERVERFETHGALVFLAGDEAWKIKR